MWCWRAVRSTPGELFEHESGRELLWNTGGLDIGPGESLDPIAAALDSGDAAFEWLNSSAPQLDGFNLPREWRAIHQPDAGVLRARSCLNAFQELGRANGARILSNTRVIALEDRQTCLEVKTDAESLEADSVVVASAGWSRTLLDPMGLTVPIRVTREHVAYFRTMEGADFKPFIWHPGDGQAEHYGLPGMKEAYIKLGQHGSGPEVVPGSYVEPDQMSIERLADFVRDRLPGLVPEAHMSETCLYASTPDDDFVIDRVGKIVLGLGFGGHGFKFAPVVGKMLADLVDGTMVDFSTRFSALRLGQSSGMTSHAG